MKFLHAFSSARILMTGLVLLLVLGFVVPKFADAKVFRKIDLEGDPGDGYSAVQGTSGSGGVFFKPQNDQDYSGSERSTGHYINFPVVWLGNSFVVFDFVFQGEERNWIAIIRDKPMQGKWN